MDGADSRASALRLVGEHDGQKGQQSGQGLHVDDGALGGYAAEDSGDDHTSEKEEPDGVGAVAADDTPEQACGEEAVVEPLIGGQPLRGLGELGGEPEGTHAEGPGPEKHLQDQEGEMEHGHHDEGYVRKDVQGGTSSLQCQKRLTTEAQKI